MTSVARKALAGVLELSKEEAEHQGDYQHAGEVLELAMTQTLTEAELGSEQKLRARLKDLLKLAEMKWRYRVVDQGQSPRDEAIKASQGASHAAWPLLNARPDGRCSKRRMSTSICTPTAP